MVHPLDQNRDGERESRWLQVALADASSSCSSLATSLVANVGKLRDQLFSENALAPQDGCLRLTKGIAFASPSPTSALVKGRSSTGHGDCSRTTDHKRLGDVLRER